MVEKPLQLAQTAALLEIIHGLIGLVRSPITATLPQIGSRLYVTWGILWSFPETQKHMFVSSLVMSWSITEIIRYSFFGMKGAFGAAPSFLLWLRYSTFMLLYPSGITSEVGLIYTAMPFMKKVIVCGADEEDGLSVGSEEDDGVMEEYYQFGEITRKRVRFIKISDDGKKTFQTEKPLKKLKSSDICSIDENNSLQAQSIFKDAVPTTPLSGISSSAPPKFSGDLTVIGGSPSCRQKTKKLPTLEAKSASVIQAKKQSSKPSNKV